MKNRFAISILLLFILIASLGIGQTFKIPIFPIIGIDGKALVNVCAETKLLPTEHCKDVIKVRLLPKDLPTKFCDKCNKVEKDICAETSLLANPYCPVVEVREFIKGKEPTEVCGLHKEAEKVKVEICIESGLLKNPYCPQLKWQEYIKGTEPTSVCDIHKEPDPLDPPKLAIRNDILYYKDGGQIPIYLCGNSARQILRSHVEICPPIDWTLAEYEKRIIDSDTNFVREDIIDVERWGTIVKAHTEKFVKNGIVIQYTLADGGKWGYGDYSKAIEFLKPYKDHIILEAGNEFFDMQFIDRAIIICRAIEGAGFISSAGAWGYADNGWLAELFLAKYIPQIITMHQPCFSIPEYTDWIAYLKSFGWPVIQNEFNLDYEPEIREYAELGFELGLAGFNVYAGDHLRIMGELCKKYNKE